MKNINERVCIAESKVINIIKFGYRQRMLRKRDHQKNEVRFVTRLDFTLRETEKYMKLLLFAWWFFGFVN